MLSNTRQFVTSVTSINGEDLSYSRECGLSHGLPSHEESRRGAVMLRLHVMCMSEINGQKQLESAASPKKVRELLNAGRNGGMTQRHFEMTTAKLRPGRAESLVRRDGWRGVLWNHYYLRGARMKLISFAELVDQLGQNNWITPAQFEHFNAYIAKKQATVVFARERKSLLKRGKVSPRHSLYANEDGT